MATKKHIKQNNTRKKGGSISSKSRSTRSKSRGFFQSPTPKSLEKTCAICLETIETKHIKTKCKHDFHKDCLIQWCENQKQHSNTKCPICRSNIQDTCDKIIPFDSTKIFQYTNIAGADNERLHKSTKKIEEFINNKEFDVNVINPNTGRSILYTLSIHADYFYDYIQKLLDNKNIHIDTNIISLITSKYISNDKIIKLFKTNKQAKKMLKEFT